MVDISKIFVSIVMPVYNRENIVKESIYSVLNQTFTNFELIVVNDASTDCTVERIKEIGDKRIRILDMECNSGANVARNNGIYAAKGDYIAFIDSDDCWMPDKLQEQISYMINQNLKVSFTPYEFRDTKEVVPVDFMSYKNDYKKIRDTLRMYNIVGTPTLIIKREIVEVIGGFDENIPRLQDYEYVIRIVGKFDIGCCPKILLSVGTATSGRISNNKEGLYKALGYIISKHYNFINLCTDSIFFKNIFINDELDMNIFQMIVDNCDKYKNEFFNAIICEQQSIIKRNNAIIKKVQGININSIRSEQFLIWGAGKQGKKVYNELKKIGKKPRYFVISGKPIEQFIDGIEVVNINNINTENYDVILGVARKTQYELMDKITKYKFKCIII